MNEEQYRYLFSKMSQSRVQFRMNQSLLVGKCAPEEFAAHANSRCLLRIPQGLKRCASCEDKHLVFMYFRQRSGWHCGFRTEERKKLPREFTFKSSTTLRGVGQARQRPGPRVDREGFEIDVRAGKGGIWLRLSDEQYRALGGVL